MNRETLTLAKGVTPRPPKIPAHRKVESEADVKPAIKSSANTWDEYKREHRAATKPSKKKTTLFLRRRVREQNRNRNRANFTEHPVKEAHEKKQSNAKQFFAQNTLASQLSEDTVKSLMNLKEDLAKAKA